MSPTPQRRFPLARLAPAALLSAMLALSACATAASLRSAATPLDTYTLNPLASPAATQSGSRIVYVADPTANAAIAGDRIAIKPNSIQVALLGDGRWIEALPLHVRNVLARSLANTGRFAFVGTSTVGPLPDFTLLTDIDAFQAETTGGGDPARVVVSMTLTVLRDVDGRLVASRHFVQTANAPATDARSLVLAFDAANGALLRDAVPWATSVMTGRPSS
ncbi:MAG: ABC-type transport auxiliary lipoprotein family protein [Amaricoccus sp.]|uniref:ABC-type transport auxiliary lipoprotein family protein n=1 Tax=Amaricoccus sp. TaxID=1872485 RepID=UPI0039E2952B